MLILTDEDILKDIEEFKQRIYNAQAKLAELPKGHLPYKEHQKREKAQRILKDEINHVQRLIEIAEESLSLDHYYKNHDNHGE